MKDIRPLDLLMALLAGVAIGVAIGFAAASGVDGSREVGRDRDREPAHCRLCRDHEHDRDGRPLDRDRRRDGETGAVAPAVKK